MTGFWVRQSHFPFLPSLTNPPQQFSFQNSFSGQVLEESWTLTFYNVLFTVLPPVVLGVFDQFVGARMLDRYPELYKLGQQNKFVRLSLVIPSSGGADSRRWMCSLAYESSGSGLATLSLILSFGKPFSSRDESLTVEVFDEQIVYVITVAIFYDELILPQGWIGGQWFWGTTLYLSVLLTVLAKAAIISEYVSSLSCLQRRELMDSRQSVDEIHPPRHSRIIRLHDDLPTPLRPHRPPPRLLAGVHEHRPSTMELASLLVDNNGSSHFIAHERFRLEIVSLSLILRKSGGADAVGG